MHVIPRTASYLALHKYIYLDSVKVKGLGEFGVGAGSWVRIEFFMTSCKALISIRCHCFSNALPHTQRGFVSS